MEKLCWKDVPTYIPQCQEIEILTREGDMNNQPKIQELIRKHRKMFQDLPMELPPNGKTKYIIKIEPGTKPANNNPYRYPH